MAEEAKVVPFEGSKGLLKMLSATLSRFALAQKLGLTHDGKRDLYDVFGYKQTLVPDDYYGKYIRQDIAARIVDAFPSATWSAPPTVEGPKRFLKRWNDLNAEFKIFQILMRLDRLLGLGDYAVLYIGLNDGRSPDMPAQPRPNNKVLYMQPYGQNSMRIADWDTDIRSPRYGLPLHYEIRAENISSTGGQSVNTPFNRKAIKVHWSRCIHVVEDPLENEVYGIARLQRVYNLLDDLMKITGGTAETYWITANRGMQVDIDKEMSLTEADAKDLSDEIEEYQHQLRRFIRTRGAKITPLGSDVPDPRGAFDILVTMLSGSLGIPKRILLGSEAGQLASEQDRTNWANRIDERRMNFAEPYVLWPMFNRFLDLGILPAGPTKFVWPSAFRMSPFEKAQTAAQKARSAANLYKLVDGDRKAEREDKKMEQEQERIDNPPEPQAQSGQSGATDTPVPPKQPTGAAEADMGGSEIKTSKMQPLLTRDEMRKIILTDELQPEAFDDPGDITRTET